MGRKTRLTQEVSDRLCSALAAGNTVKNSCALAGVGDRAYYTWLEKASSIKSTQSKHGSSVAVVGDKESDVYLRFARDCTQALARAEDDAVRTIRRTMLDPENRDNWRCAIEYLRRRNPEDWAATRVLRVKVEEGVGEVLEAVRSKMSKGAYKELIEAITVVSGEEAGHGTGDDVH